MRMPRRVAVAIAGAAFVAAGTTTVMASGPQVSTNPPYGAGYQFPPNSYDVSGGPQSVTFSYTLKNLTKSAISTTDVLDVSRIVEIELNGVWTDVTSGYPSLTDSQVASAASNNQTDQDYNVITRSQTITVPASGSLPVSFSFSVSLCGYYQMDSFGSPVVSGLFATGFIRVIGCAASPTPTPSPSPSPSPSGGVGAGSPTPSPSPSPSGSASPSASASPSPSATSTPTPGGGGGSPTPSPTGGVLGSTPTPTPTGGVQATTSPSGGVLAASTPGTGSGPTGGSLTGLFLIGLGALLLLGALVAGRRPQPI